MKPDICANKHHYDPNSFLANIHIDPHKRTLREKIYKFLEEHGPATCESIALRLNLRYTTVSARLSELKSMTWVTPMGTRKTTGGDSAAVIRALSEADREKLLHPTRGYRPKQAELFPQTAS
jgi:Mn-dependent DtxR family transcriptional regulator